MAPPFIPPHESRRLRPGAAASTAPAGLALLVGYGRGAAGMVEALAGVGVTAARLPRFGPALVEIDALRPELVLVGEDVEAGDPLDFLRELGAARDGAVVVFLAASGDRARARRALGAGADDVLCPPHSLSAILLRREVHLRIKAATPPRAEPARCMRIGHLTVDLATRQVTDGVRPLTLSGREFELLVRLMEAEGDVVRREVLLEDIWGDAPESTGVLDATVHRLRRKLDDHLDEAEMVATVRGIGYRLAAVPAPGKPAH